MKTISIIQTTLLILGAMGMLAGCGDDEPANTDTGADGDSDSDVEVCDEGDPSAVCSAGPVNSIALTDANNYVFDSSLHVTPVEVKGAATLVDLNFEWSALTHSFLDEEVSATTDIDMVVVSLWELSQAELEEKINNDTLMSSDRMGAICAETGGTMTEENLLDFNICFGEPVADNIADVTNYFNGEAERYDPNLFTHMLMVKSGTNLDGNLNVHMLKFFTLNPAIENTTVSIDNSSATLDFTADLRGQSRIPVAAGNPSINLDWSNVVTNSLGNPFVPTQITRVVVAHYPMDVCQLENQFLHLETIHDAWYEKQLLEVTQTFDLSQLTDAGGNSFPGITADGTWIVGLFCGSCGNPAPWFMTILQPC